MVQTDYVVYKVCLHGQARDRLRYNLHMLAQVANQIAIHGACQCTHSLDNAWQRCARYVRVQVCGHQLRVTGRLLTYVCMYERVLVKECHRCSTARYFSLVLEGRHKIVLCSRVGLSATAISVAVVVRSNNFRATTRRSTSGLYCAGRFERGNAWLRLAGRGHASPPVRDYSNSRLHAPSVSAGLDDDMPLVFCFSKSPKF